MKLTDNQLAVAKEAIGADPIAHDHPAMEQLEAAFGEHTFYVSQQGLLVFEPDAEAADGGAEEPARLVLMAAWTDDEKTELARVEPQATDVTIDLAGSEGED